MVTESRQSSFEDVPVNNPEALAAAAEWLRLDTQMGDLRVAKAEQAEKLRDIFPEGEYAGKNIRLSDEVVIKARLKAPLEIKARTQAASYSLQPGLTRAAKAALKKDKAPKAPKPRTPRATTATPTKPRKPRAAKPATA